VKVAFKKSFAKDLKKKANDKNLLSRVDQILGQVDVARDISEIPNLKKLKSDGEYYRIRIGDYRLGLIIENGTIIFVRLLHRSEIYRYFP
jgi:mRNA interferase RelE/StbE